MKFVRAIQFILVGGAIFFIGAFMAPKISLESTVIMVIAVAAVVVAVLLELAEWVGEAEATKKKEKASSNKKATSKKVAQKSAHESAQEEEELYSYS